jgi:hypothetical protein
MFTALLPLFAATVVLTAGGLAPEPRVLTVDSLSVAGTAPASATATPSLAMLPSISAQLYITSVGNGYYLVVVDGQSSAAHAPVGARVYGDDPWFDDYQFDIHGIQTDSAGRFNLSLTVYRSALDEDWEGRDEIYAIAEVSGAGRTRTNTISRSF